MAAVSNVLFWVGTVLIAGGVLLELVPALRALFAKTALKKLEPEYAETVGPRE